MAIEVRTDPKPQASDWLVGGGEAGRLIRATDWSQTSLGPIEAWPQSLRSAVSILLPSKAQIILFWGPDLIALYNDAYVPVLGAKHPRALGLPAREVWSELWEVGLRGLFEGVLATGEAFWARDRPFFMDRLGFKEETYFDISYDPVRDESGQVGGLFCIVSETTERVVGERRLRTLRDLSTSTAARSSSVDDECRTIAANLDRHRLDVAFTLLYLLEEGDSARLVGTSGLVPGTPAAPVQIGLADSGRGAAAWPLDAVLRANRAQVVEDLSRFGDVPSGAWPESAHTAVVLPVGGAGAERPVGFLVAGVSPRRLLDDAYRAFFDLLAGQVATSLASARAYEQERRRAEALAELDRAKTTFFSNVSHEFRTPLTLMLGPVEDLLSRGDADLSASTRTQLDVVSRNGTRLLRLVNALLEFSRIEAGRVRADYRPTDLAALTAGLAGVFRSACERAGLSLVVDCRQLSAPVFVDRDMWEKVVLNLVSNAFKFTFTGEIAVEVRQAGSAAQLEVRDTGTGVPAEEMPRLFERFHRIDKARGRTHEGSGIGLALVQELVRLHGGSIVARSEVGRGTSFVVSIPFGTAHLPADQVSSGRAGSLTGTGAAPYVEEALRWLPEEEASEVPLRDEPQAADRPEPDPAGHDGRPTVLVADDNADMRQYVRRILAERFHVIAVADGEAALASARGRRPDLVLTDVMMPRLDGFALLRELRSGAATRDVPVIMLSARAGEESRVEGMQAGADDYMIKPFGARELLARVEALVKLSRLRREAAETLRTSEERSRLAQSVARVGTFEWNVRTGGVTWTPELEAIFGLKPGAFGGTRADFERLVHPDDRSGVVAVAEEAIRSGEPTEHEFRIVRPDGGARWIAGRFQCFRDAQGEPVRISGVNIDVTERKRTEEALRESRRHLAAELSATTRLHALSGRLLAAGDLVAALDDVLENALATCGADFGNIQLLDRGTRALEIAVHRGFHEEFLDHFRTVQVDDGSACARAMGSGEPITVEDVELDPAFEPHRSVAASAGFRAVHSTPLKTHDGTIVGMLSTHFRDPHRVSERDRRLLDLYARHAADLIERVRSEEALKAADRRKDEFLATLAHELRNPLAPLRNGLELMTIAPDDAAVHQEAREMMRRQLDHMVRLVDDLLDLSRIRRDKLQLRKGRFHLRHLLDCALETSRPLLEAGRHQVSVQCPSEPIVLDADATRITQVFANLLNNAAKFTPSGGRVDVEVRADDGDAVVEVRDSGVGIDADMIERVFDMFAQAETVAGEGKGGLGIGLTLAKRLSEMHGGSIGVASAGLGKGCAFTVRLPRLRSESEAHVAPVRRGPPTTVPQSVLVADDNVDAATSLAMLLRVSGHDVRVANDGEQAIQAVKMFLPTVVILDLGMPRVNGYDAARQIRENAGARCPLLVAVTGWGQESDRRRTKDAGFDLHFVKPIDFTELNAALQRRSG